MAEDEQKGSPLRAVVQGAGWARQVTAAGTAGRGDQHRIAGQRRSALGPADDLVGEQR